MLSTLRLEDGHPKGPGQKTGPKKRSCGSVFVTGSKRCKKNRKKKRRRRWKIT